MSLRKVPPAELRIVIALMPLMEARVAEAAQALREAGERFAHANEAGATWAHLYDLPFREHLARAAVEFGIDREVVAASQGVLPMSVLRDLAAAVGTEGDPVSTLPPESVGPGPSWAFVGAGYSLLASIRALLVHGVFLNDLLARARERHDDRAFLNAVRIDPTVLSSRTGGVRLGRACLEGDSRFLAAIRRAMAGVQGPAQQARMQRARAALLSLAQSDALSLDDAGLHRRLGRALRGAR